MNIAILSYRISGNDGVSLECKHWKNILTDMGHKVVFLGGELDVPGILMPELHFQWPHVMQLHDDVVYGSGNYHHIEDKIFDIAGTIEGKLRKVFKQKQKPDLLIVANALSLPMHFPLAVALKRFLEETELPTIGRHHDFWWERDRYSKSHLFHFFERWFPPDLPNMRHVVINSFAQKELKKRFGFDSEIIADSFDFTDTKLSKLDAYSKGFRKDFGIKHDDIVFLQATRIVPRKRIELSMKLIQMLDLPKAVLVVAGHSGDEGKAYEAYLRKVAKQLGIRCEFIGDQVDTQRRVIAESSWEIPVREKVYTLWDCYNNADFVTYPTSIEGFGNQFIEAVFFKKPVIMTSYPVYKKDIAPIGFDVVEMTPNISKSVISKIKNIATDKKARKEMIEKNFALGKANFSYEARAVAIKKIITSFKLKNK